MDLEPGQLGSGDQAQFTQGGAMDALVGEIRHGSRGKGRGADRGEGSERKGGEKSDDGNAPGRTGEK